MAGSIKLFRQFRDWEWYQDENVKSVFIELLLTANYKDLRWQGKVVKRGQLITSRAKLAAYLGKTEQNIRTALGKLQSTGEIELKATNKYTLITICKYDYWQSQNGYEQPTTNQPTNQPTNQQLTNEQPTTNQQLTNEQPTTNQQLTTSKEREEYKEREEIHTQRACACEDEKFFAKMKQSFTAWQADTCRCLKIDQAALARLIEEFETECKAKNACHISWADITSHFVDWGRRQVEKQQKQESYGNNNRTSNRGAYEPTGLEDYSGERL